MKKFALIGCLTMVLGLVIFGTSMAFLDFDYRNMSTTEPFEQKQMTVEDSGQDIVIEDHNTKVTVGLSPDDQIHLQYYERETDYYDIEKEGTLRIQKVSPLVWSWFHLDFYGWENNLTLLLPASYHGDIDIHTSNDDITVTGIAAETLSLRTTNDSITVEEIQVADQLTLENTNGSLLLENSQAGEVALSTTNGRITMDDVEIKNGATLHTINHDFSIANVTVGGSLEGDNYNGEIELDDVTAADMIYMHTGNGRVSATNTASKEFDIKTTNNDVVLADVLAEHITLDSVNGLLKGSILGAAEEYNIQSSTMNGDNNLGQRVGTTDKTLSATTTNGHIELQFIPID